MNIEVIEMSECECGNTKTNEVLTVCAGCKVVLTAEKVDKKPTQEE